MASMPHPKAPGSRPTGDKVGAKSQRQAPAHEASVKRTSAIHRSRGAVQRGDPNDWLEAER